MKKNKALINYYARLIKKGQFEENNIPSDMREDVMTKVAELPPISTDPETKAPS